MAGRRRKASKVYRDKVGDEKVGRGKTRMEGEVMVADKGERGTIMKMRDGDVGKKRRQLKRER